MSLWRDSTDTPLKDEERCDLVEMGENPDAPNALSINAFRKKSVRACCTARIILRAQNANLRSVKGQATPPRSSPPIRCEARMRSSQHSGADKSLLVSPEGTSVLKCAFGPRTCSPQAPENFGAAGRRRRKILERPAAGAGTFWSGQPQAPEILERPAAGAGKFWSCSQQDTGILELPAAVY